MTIQNFFPQGFSMALSGDLGVFLPLTAVYDPAVFPQIEELDPGIKELIIVSGQYYNNIASVLNLKDTGYYITSEIVNSQSWFSSSPSINNIFRSAFRIVINFGALPNATTKSVAHNITGLTAGVMSWTRIYGTATDASGNGIPLPYSSNAANANIELNVDLTNVNVTTAIDYSAFTTTYIILEYLKN